MALIDKAKAALRITDNDFNDEITDLIATAKIDLAISGVVLPDELDEACERAIITYCKVNFGYPDGSRVGGGSYDKLKASYDEQKSQLRSATGYTEW